MEYNYYKGRSMKKSIAKEEHSKKEGVINGIEEIVFDKI